MKTCFVALVFYLIFSFSFGQETSIELGPDKIALNQGWTIGVKVANGKLTQYDGFPDIKDFSKGGVSTEQKTYIYNGQISGYQIAKMTYYPSKEGTFVVPPFKMRINNQEYSSPGKKITVGPPINTRQKGNNPFQDFFGRDPFNEPEPTEFIDIKEDAFLALTTDQDEVYVGEGVHVSLAFYVSVNNMAPMSFYKPGEQITDIKKMITPQNIWEENFRLESLTGELVNIGNKQYYRHKLIETTYFPLNEDPLIFPSVPLEMVKYKVAKNPTFFGQNKKTDYTTFYSKPKKVKVKPLPPHPLKNQVAVGDYYLKEKIATSKLETGRNVTYEFKIFGEGNLASIRKPEIPTNEIFDFYNPTIDESINRLNRKVTGEKSFHYNLIPKEPGNYAFKDYFSWIFFNPKKGLYDTLQSEITVNVAGESKKNEVIQSTDIGSFYDKINTADHQQYSRHNDQWQYIFFNIFTIVVLGLTVFLVFKK